MKKGYAYLDQYGNMHIVDDIKTARKYSGNGKIETVTGIDYEYGWPQVMFGDDREAVIVKVKGDEITEKEGRPIPKQLKELAERLK